MTMNAIAIAIGAGAPPTPFLPSSLPNLVAWYRLGIGITVVTGVSQWSDQSGNGNHLLQATGAKQPALQGDNSILFDGATQFLRASAFTLNQPTTVYLRFRQVTWTSGRFAFDGNTVNSGSLKQNNVTPEIDLFAGGFAAPNTNLAVNTYGGIACVFNGVSSLIQVNATAATTGNAGAANMGGFTLGCEGDTAGGNSNIQVKEVCIYSVAHDTPTRAQVITYLNTL